MNGWHANRAFGCIAAGFCKKCRINLAKKNYHNGTKTLKMKYDTPVVFYAA